ncbi:MAG: outer membrane beta-barrel protein [Saprospiraceae bacterium]
MKKSLLLSLAILACYLPANAQLSFGIKGGVNNAWHSGANDAPKMQGLSTSLTVYKKLGKFLEIGMEPGFVQRGTTQQYGYQNYYYYCDVCCFGPCYDPTLGDMSGNPYQGLKASYIQAPMMVRGSLPLAKGKVVLSGKMGGGPSYLSSGYYGETVMDETSYFLKPASRELDFSEDDGTGTKRWDWGLYGGMGVGYQLGFGLLSLEMEHYRGFSKVSEYLPSKNRGISYSLGYTISL